MKKNISVLIAGKKSVFEVEKVFESDHFEHYKVSGANRNIILQTNRKLWTSKGVKHRTGEWKLIEGQLNNASALEAIITAISNLSI